MAEIWCEYEKPIIGYNINLYQINNLVLTLSVVDPEGQSDQGLHAFWQWTFVPPPAKNKLIVVNFPNLCDNFVKKLVSEIRKCRLL